MHAVKLTPRFDAKRLLDDCRRLRSAAEARPAGFPGEAHVGWQAVTLQSHEAGDNRLSGHAPYLGPALDALGLATRLVRMMSLEPGGVIREHSDTFLSSRIVRLHIPVVTHDQVEFHLDGQRCAWAPGELWYGDFSRPHRAVNLSDITRIHIVIDALADDRLARLFPHGLPAQLAERLAASESPLSEEALRRLSFDFVLPPGFALPGATPLGPDEALPGAIRIIDNELRLFVNGQPMLKAVPVSEDVVELLGLDFDARLLYEFDGGAARRVTLEIGATPVLVIDAQGS